MLARYKLSFNVQQKKFIMWYFEQWNLQNFTKQLKNNKKFWNYFLKNLFLIYRIKGCIIESKSNLIPILATNLRTTKKSTQ